MPKKHKRDRHEPTPAEHEAPAVVTQSVHIVEDAPTALTDMLENIRAEAKATRHNTAQSITELEAMRAEIDAAIAFLKAGRR